MNLATLELSPEQVATGLSEYTSLRPEARSVEDEAIAMGYRAAARGMPIVVLSEVFRAGGFFESGHPRLAVARADAWTVSVHHDGRDIIFDDDDVGLWRSRNRGALVGRSTVRVRDVRPSATYLQRVTTTVPLVPPRHRPKRSRLGLFHILWEVERWDPTPPVDPALLRHIRGDLWAVVAMWDLTDLERAVLAART